MSKDLTNFNKLSDEKQLAIIEALIASFPEDKQSEIRKELLGE